MIYIRLPDFLVSPVGLRGIFFIKHDRITNARAKRGIRYWNQQNFDIEYECEIRFFRFQPFHLTTLVVWVFDQQVDSRHLFPYIRISWRHFPWLNILSFALENALSYTET